MPDGELNEGLSAAEFRAAAVMAKDANQARRLLALAAVRDGLGRAEAARIGGMDRQTLCDWVHAYNARGIGGLINKTPPGAKPKLNSEQKLGLKEIALKGPDPAIDGVVRWRCRDLARVVEAKFGVKVDEDTIGRTLRQMGLSHISARPRHPEQKADAIEIFQKRSPTN